MQNVIIKKHQKLNLEFKRLREHFSYTEQKTTVKNLLHTGEYNAITVCFSDIEGRLHMLDYDIDFLLKSEDNLTFDGSSIRGFTNQSESDLKINLDWSACYFLPECYFGKKIFIFAEIKDKNGKEYSSDIRSTLKKYLNQLKISYKYRINVAAEIEGFLFNGPNLEKTYYQQQKFPYVTTGGYFDTLPGSLLRKYIDEVAKVQRYAGFENEKDHPEVAPSQFEINWSYTEALVAADQIQLYKMICRQVAAKQNLTACFLPKPIVGVNGNGMHINISLANLNQKNLFFDFKNNLSEKAWNFIRSVLNHGEEICLGLNSSVNAYRRLDPNFEAPNEIKASVIDRGSMIRIPMGNEKSARIEIRTISPDANPYLAILAILKAGLAGKNKKRVLLSNKKNPRENIIYPILPSDIYTAIKYFRKSKLMRESLGYITHRKYIKWKEETADRCPRKLGTTIKPCEIMFHHEVTNQQLWNMF